MKGVTALKPILSQAVGEAMNDKEIDNPIYRVIRQLVIQKHVEVGSVNDFIIKKLNDIENKIVVSQKPKRSAFQEDMDSIIISTRYRVKSDEGGVGSKIFDLLKRNKIQAIRVNSEKPNNGNIYDVTVTYESGSDALMGSDIIKKHFPELEIISLIRL